MSPARPRHRHRRMGATNSPSSRESSRAPVCQLFLFLKVLKRFLRTALMSCYEYYLRLSHLHRDELFFSRASSIVIGCRLNYWGRGWLPTVTLALAAARTQWYQCLRSADPVFAPIRSSTSSSFRDVDGELCLMNILLVLLPSKFPVPVHQDRSYARDSCYQWHLVWQSDTHYMNQRLVTYPFMLETVCADGWCWYVLQKCYHCHSWWRFQAIPKGLFEYSHV